MKDGAFVALGLYEVHMASAALSVDGEVVAASHEERFTGLKNDVGFPLHAARFCLEAAGIAPEEVDEVGMVNEAFPPSGIANILFKRPALFEIADWVDENERYWRPRLLEGRDPGSFFEVLGGWDRVAPGHHYALDGLDMDAEAGLVSKAFNECRRRAVADGLGIPADRVRFLPHYLCHHHHAYYSGPLRGDDVVVVHCEGDGGLYNQAVSLPGPRGLEVVAGSASCDLGRLYQWITLALGMKPYHHEYKLMGLAPHANPREVERAYAVFEPVFRLAQNGLAVEYAERPRDLFWSFRDRLVGQRFDGVAGALQRLVEERLAEWLASVVAHTGRRRVAYGGGVAMNTKANLQLRGLPGVEELFVPLSPGDESNTLGACYGLTEARFRADGRDPGRIPALSHAYLGADLRASDVARVLEQAARDGHAVQPGVDAESVAARLARGEVVARVDGRGEFGQRSLGNRSILAHPGRPGTVDKINHQIKYRDFWMPFAPTILARRALDYLDVEAPPHAPFMTVCFDSRPERRREIAEATHPADGSVRAQVLEPGANPGYQHLLEAFERRTGIGGLLNTSFNLHGEPMVSTADEAYRTFARSRLDALWLGGALIARRPGNAEG